MTKTSLVGKFDWDKSAQYFPGERYGVKKNIFHSTDVAPDENAMTCARFYGSNGPEAPYVVGDVGANESYEFNRRTVNGDEKNLSLNI